MKREKECVMEELARLNLEKSTKSIGLYDPNSPETLNKKISKINESIIILFILSIIKKNYLK